MGIARPRRSSVLTAAIRELHEFPFTRRSFEECLQHLKAVEQKYVLRLSNDLPSLLTLKRSVGETTLTIATGKDVPFSAIESELREILKLGFDDVVKEASIVHSLLVHFREDIEQPQAKKTYKQLLNKLREQLAWIQLTIDELKQSPPS